MAYSTRDVLETMRKDSGLRVRELRVDGGASANDFLCRFQADILGVPVVRPKTVETTSLGAAYLAGLGAGVWDSTAAIERLAVDERKFTPAMTPGPGRQALRRMAGGRPQSPRRLMVNVDPPADTFGARSDSRRTSDIRGATETHIRKVETLHEKPVDIRSELPVLMIWLIGASSELRSALRPADTWRADWPVLKTYDRDHVEKIALPLGGIGTGTVSLGGRGNLMDWEIMNRPAKGYIPYGGQQTGPFFAVHVGVRGSPVHPGHRGPAASLRL